MKKIVILGSTGSIGRQTLDVVSQHPEAFKVIGLSGHSNYELLEKQAREFKPLALAMTDSQALERLREALSDTPIEFMGIEQLASLEECNLVVNALVGSVGLTPTLKAIQAGKDIALANKESLVVGGELVCRLAQEKKVKILPVDSEHSAIFQSLRGEDPSHLRRIILTGSGGPFWGRNRRELREVTVEEALAHPRWKMGAKISIDSATLMNKGLEVIEAHFLFGLSYDSIEVIIHPQSFIHSMVEFKDGSIKAQMGATDMHIPIQYALSFPERFSSPLAGINIGQVESLTFEEPDWDNFPCLGYAYEAGRRGGSYPAVLNAANEEAVAAFLNRKIGFLDISEVIDETLNSHIPFRAIDLEGLIEAENWARKKARELIEKL